MKSKGESKDLISMSDFSDAEIASIMEVSHVLKADRKKHAEALQGKTLAMIFQKPSTRTAVSFTVGMSQMGGHPLALNNQDLQIKRGESMPDTARTLSRYVDCIMIRANKHEDVIDLAKWASVPVINGLTDKEHPCQVLSDLFTIIEHKKCKSVSDLKKLKVTYVGDGNNMAHSWILLAAMMGMEFVASSPKNYAVEKEFVQRGEEIAKKTGARLSYESDPLKAVDGADVIYTDVWASMGKDEERDQRKQIFMPYQVNSKLLGAAKPDAIVMHCLPAHRGEEITEEVMEGPRSVIFDQAENRLHVQKAILLHLLT